MVLLTEVVRRFFCPFSRQFSLPFPWRFYAPPPSFVLGRVGAEDCCFVFSACVRIFVSVSLVIAYRVVRLSNRSSWVNLHAPLFYRRPRAKESAGFRLNLDISGLPRLGAWWHEHLSSKTIIVAYKQDGA